MASATSIKLDAELKSRIQRLAATRRRSSHWIMHEAIVQHVAREAFKQDALRAWDDFEASGLHATADEVEGWLSTWGTEDELPAPA